MAGELRALYGWLDAVPLSHGHRNNLARDFSDGGCTANVPTSSTPQKLANWGHLNRKVLRKLNFSVPAEVMRQVVQCRPGAVEQGAAPAAPENRGRSRSRTRRCLLRAGARCTGSAGEVSYLETGRAPARRYLKARSDMGGGCAQESPRAAGGKKSCPGCAQAAPGDATGHLRLAEREQALLLAQETIQILQLKVGRLEQLLRLKNVRIDDLSRRLREAQSPQR
ncbi:unnamed protein product [Bubo scandiacus]